MYVKCSVFFLAHRRCSISNSLLSVATFTLISRFTISQKQWVAKLISWMPLPRAHLFICWSKLFMVDTRNNPRTQAFYTRGNCGSQKLFYLSGASFGAGTSYQVLPLLPRRNPFRPSRQKQLDCKSVWSLSPSFIREVPFWQVLSYKSYFPKRRARPLGYHGGGTGQIPAFVKFTSQNLSLK